MPVLFLNLSDVDKRRGVSPNFDMECYMNKNIQRGLALVGALSTGAAMAAGPDLTPLTSQVDFGTVTVAVLSIAGLLAVVYVAIKGAKIGLSMLRGG